LQPWLSATLLFNTNVNMVPNKVIKLELKLAALADCHTYFNTVDHISERRGEALPLQSTLEKTKLRRTKTSALSRNVLAWTK
jgi:hypothetical protein